ncbi:hypothetical protein JF66_08005 [Cryobacterium sp. MLB-32]|nr:hypothetical protein JF66_08005 [Cryobacterium sp. MLB-32]
MRTYLTAFSSLGAAAVLSRACSGTVAETISGDRLYTSTAPQPVDEALIVGTIAQRCVGLEDADGVMRAVI